MRLDVQGSMAVKGYISFLDKGGLVTDNPANQIQPGGTTPGDNKNVPNGAIWVGWSDNTSKTANFIYYARWNQNRYCW